MKKNKIECVKMTRKIRDEIYFKTKDMSPEELMDFYSKHEKSEVDKKSTKKQKAA